MIIVTKDSWQIINLTLDNLYEISKTHSNGKWMQIRYAGGKVDWELESSEQREWLENAILEGLINGKSLMVLPF